MLIAPAPQRVEIPTLLLDVEVWERLWLLFGPICGNDIWTGRTHNILTYDINAMTDMGPVYWLWGRKRLIWVVKRVVDILAQHVQAMELVESINFAKIRF